MLKLLISTLLVVNLWSCSKKMGPDETLHHFVSSIIDGKMTKDELLDSTTANMRTDLENLDDEAMAKYLKLEGASRDSFHVNLSNCQNDVCYLTYTLKYEQSKNGTKTFDVELKKMAELHKVDEKWLLADVTDIKTYYEAQQPIEP